VHCAVMVYDRRLNDVPVVPTLKSAYLDLEVLDTEACAPAGCETAD